MIRGYPHRVGVLPGDILQLHVAADAPVRFQIWFYRQGEALVLKARTGALQAQARPLGALDRSWNWPVYEYPIPRDWESGPYVALFVPAEQANGTDPADPGQHEAAALFVVRSRRALGKILYKLPLLTYHAHNALGDPCSIQPIGGCSKLSLHRPGGGVGGWPRDQSLYRHTFWHLDAPFIAWLERKRFEVNYCTDLDIHGNRGNFLAGYRLLLSVGHDQYWSDAMRRNLAAFVEQTGGNVAFFSGKNCGTAVNVVDGDTAIVCEMRTITRTDRNRNGCNGDALPRSKRGSVGHTVQHADHWVFEGTGLRDGDTFGADHVVLGYESSDPGICILGTSEETSENLITLGTRRIGSKWSDESGDFARGDKATMWLNTKKGSVFTASDTEWVRMLASGDVHTEKITENVLCRLGAGETKHPVATAWSRLCSARLDPNSIEILQEQQTRNCVYRIDRVGSGGTTVIAKRCTAQEACVEQTVYQKILPHLPVPSLRFYGCLEEPGTEYRWLFVEEAAGGDFEYDIETHRELAVSWLGQMHVAAASIPAVSRLPDRTPKHYRNLLRAIRGSIERWLDDSPTTSDDLRVVIGILSYCHLLESRWGRVEELCQLVPQTLVHGDFTKGNVRVRSTPYRTDFVVFDWGMAGYGFPGIDLAEPSGKGTTRDRIETDLMKYWSIVRGMWSDLDLAAVKALADLGSVFRMLSAISWQCDGVRPDRWPIAELHSYRSSLADPLENLGFL